MKHLRNTHSASKISPKKHRNSFEALHASSPPSSSSSRICFSYWPQVHRCLLLLPSTSLIEKGIILRMEVTWNSKPFDPLAMWWHGAMPLHAKGTLPFLC